MVLQHPEHLWALPLALAAIAAWRLLRRRPYFAFPLADLLRSHISRASRLRQVPTVIALAALPCIALALTDPVLPFTEGHVRSRGLDIVLVLDLSSSMQEVMGGKQKGAGPTRLETVKRALTEFINQRPEDRIGLVVFSDYSYVVSPLTLDHDYLRMYVSMIDAKTLPNEGLTAIGEGIATGSALLARQKIARTTRNQVMVVFTDGEHNFGANPLDTLPAAIKAGTRVHMVGIDLAEVVKTRPVVMRLVEAVRGHGGRYFNAETAGQLQMASMAISELEKGWLVQSRYIRNQPIYHYFVLPALVLLALALSLRALPYFIDVT